MSDTQADNAASLVSGDVFVVVDAGGGTTDITAHLVEARGGCGETVLVEALAKSGGYCGSTAIDDNFVAFFRDLVRIALCLMN